MGRYAVAGRLALVSTLVSTLALACQSALQQPAAPAPEDFAAGALDFVDRPHLADLVAKAQATPNDAQAHWDAGMAHAHATLTGHMELREVAEHHLLRAHELDAEAYPTARVLGRFLNMRSAALDVSKLDLQLALYESVAHEVRRGQSSDADAFQVDCFLETGRALRDWSDGHELKAYRRLRKLERRMARRLANDEEPMDTYAMAGNFEVTFAGVLPVGRRRRARAATDYLGVQLAHWDQLTPGARDEELAPNVRSVFNLFWAETLLARGEAQAARDAYTEMLALDVPQTRAREQLVALAEHRLENLEHYAGRQELLPAWPSGVVGCVACHSRETTLPGAGLYLLTERAPWDATQP